MVLKLKNDPRIDYFEGSVDEYKQIKDDLFPEWIDIARIPEFLGKDAAERVINWLKYRIDGSYLYDSNQK